MGWFSKLEQPFVRDLSLAAWQLFADLRLDEAKKAQFSSVHDCFVRELKPGARPVDPDPAVLASPCDAIVGASGTVEGTRLFQIKGSPYPLQDLLGDAKPFRAIRGQHLRHAAHHLEHVPPLPRTA